MQAHRLTGYCCTGDMCARVCCVCVQVRALTTLIDRGTDLKAVDLTGFCYVVHFAQDHCQRLLASSVLKSLAAHADGTSSSARLPSYNAGQNWLNLIKDAKMTNPQFAQLWREHKIFCNLSPLFQDPKGAPTQSPFRNEREQEHPHQGHGLSCLALGSAW